MLLLLLNYLSSFSCIKIPAVFSYLSTRMILASLTTLFFTIGFGSSFIVYLYNLKTGQSIRVEDCPMLAALHEKKKNTPSMGGLLILTSMSISLFLWMDLTSSFTLILLFVTASLGLIGGIDDFLKMKHKNSKGLKSSYKFIAQIVVASVVCFYLFIPQVAEKVHQGRFFSPPIAKIEKKTSEEKTLQQYQGIYYLPFKKEPLLIVSGIGLFFAALFTVFVITGASNAVNLSDGLDGLAAGLVMMVSGVLAIVAFLSNHIEFAHYLNIVYIEGSGEIAVFLCGIFGACLGFLWYNSHPAQVFMGDVGSLPLGGLLGLCSVLLRKEFLFALIGGLFVIEALSVIIQVTSFRLRGGKRVFLCSPIHHHFEYKGWAETKIVIRFWIIGLLLALVGLSSLKFQ